MPVRMGNTTGTVMMMMDMMSMTQPQNTYSRMTSRKMMKRGAWTLAMAADR